MDPISIVGTAYSTTVRVNNIIKTMKEAPSDLRKVQDEALRVRGVLKKIIHSLSSSHIEAESDANEDACEPDDEDKLQSALVEQAKQLTEAANKFIDKVASVQRDGTYKINLAKWPLHLSEPKALAERFRAFHTAVSAVYAVGTSNSVQELHPKVDTIEQDVKEMKAIIMRTIFNAAQQQRDGRHHLLDELSAFRQSQITNSSLLPKPDGRIGGYQPCDQDCMPFPRPLTPSEATNVRPIPYTNCSAASTYPVTSATSRSGEGEGHESCPPNCRCQCHTPSSNPPSIPWWLHLFIPARRLSSLQSGMRGCDDSQCVQMRKNLKTIRLYMPACFMHVEATIRIRSLPIQFVIQTPRVVSRLLNEVLSISLEELKHRLATRAITPNDVESSGITLLHRLSQRAALDPDIGYEMIHYVVNAGAPKDWERDQMTVAEDLVLNIGVWASPRKRRASVDWFIHTIGGPLFGVDLDEVQESLRAKRNWTDLHVAVWNPSPTADLAAMLRQLPGLRSQVNIRDRSGCPPLHYAINSCPDAADVLLRAGANPRYHRRAMPDATKAKSLAAISPLIRAGANINGQFAAFNRTALHYAIADWARAKRDSRVALELLRHGAHRLDWTIKDDHERTPEETALHAITRFPADNQLLIINALFRSCKVPIGAQCISVSLLVGASKAVTGLKSTSLIEAGLAGNIPAIGELIHLGAMVNERDSTGRTLLHLVGMGVAPNGFQVALEVVRHGGYGVDWDAQTVDGQTALELVEETRESLTLVPDLPAAVQDEIENIRKLFLHRTHLPPNVSYIYPCMDPAYCFVCSFLPCKCIDDTGLRIPGAFIGV